MIGGIWKMLRLERDGAVLSVLDAALADERPVKQVAGVELNARLVRENLKIAAAGGIVNLTGFR
jgi:hypothetical protein